MNPYNILLPKTLVFRETLEAALFIGIMAAATKGLRGRSVYIAFGVFLGILGAFGVAMAMESINGALNGTGQEWFNIIVLGLAFAMLTWHVVWSARHGKALAGQARDLASDAKTGEASMWAMTIAIAMIVLREGAETVLFVSGATAGQPAVVEPVQQVVQVAQAAAPEAALPTAVDLTQGKADLSSAQAADLPQEVDLTKATANDVSALPQTVDLTQNQGVAAHNQAMPPALTDAAHVQASETLTSAQQNQDVLMGGLLGLLAGGLVGLLMYMGLVRLSVGRLFTLTNVLVVLLAAGMMGQVGRKLVQAQVLPSGIDPLWDSSAWLGTESMAGTFFQALMGYDAQPSMTHVLFFIGGVVLIVLAARWAKSAQV